MKRVGILGCGAVGSIISTILSTVPPNASHFSQVVLLGFWSEHLKKVKENGITIKAYDSDTQDYWKNLCNKYPEKLKRSGICFNFPLESHYIDSSVNLELFDKVILCDKTYNNEMWIKYLPKLLTTDGELLSLQNGGGNFELLARNPVLYGYLTFGCNIVSPSYVSHNGMGSIKIMYTDRKYESHAEEWRNIFTLTGMQTIIDEDNGDHKSLWQKLVINCAINTLTTLYEVKNGALTDETFKDEMNKIICECLDVMRSNSIILSDEEIEELKKLPFKIAESTKNNCSSMLTDYKKGFPLELDTILGFVIKTGEKNNCQTPFLKELYAKISNKINSQRK